MSLSWFMTLSWFCHESLWFQGGSPSFQRSVHKTSVSWRLYLIATVAYWGWTSWWKASNIYIYYLFQWLKRNHQMSQDPPYAICVVSSIPSIPRHIFFVTGAFLRFDSARHWNSLGPLPTSDHGRSENHQMLVLVWFLKFSAGISIWKHQDMEIWT